MKISKIIIYQRTNSVLMGSQSLYQQLRVQKENLPCTGGPSIAGCTHTHTHSYWDNVETPVHPTYLALGCGRKPESLEKTHTDTVCKLHTVAQAGNHFFLPHKHKKTAIEQNDIIWGLTLTNSMYIYLHPYQITPEFMLKSPTVIQYYMDHSSLPLLIICSYSVQQRETSLSSSTIHAHMSMHLSV